MLVCDACGRENPAGSSFCNACGAPLAPPDPGSERRKTVTVLFCDVIGSTALGERLDPESLRRVLARYFDVAREAVGRHGGVVEKFIGDAVMAVFGVPQVHEDDALRACRAAVEMRDALPELGVEARIGLNTGEVVTGTEERLATGDAVNVAARLEQAAAPGEILMGEETLRLVREAVEVQEVEPLALKGKSEPVPAFRLLDAGEPARRHQAPMVGRVRELDRLRDAYEQAVENRSCQLFTILGTAGVGKSRLVSEFLNDLDATVVRGRCLSYGVGITYWALVEALLQLGVRPPDERAAATLASVLGETTTPTTPDEIAWAARKTLEAAASEQPLVCVFDDIHWAEPAFLDLVEHVADFSRGFPILLLCIARPELLDRRTGWGGGKLNATTVLLEPLSAQETDDLIDRLADLDESLKERIRTAAEGNPLFVEEMLAMVREAGNGEVAVPPTIHALLAARLDQLDAAERTVLERGAVEGKVFHRGAVEALTPDEILGYHFGQACRYRAELGLPIEERIAANARERLAAAAFRARARGDERAAVNLLERAAALEPAGRYALAVELELCEAYLWTGRLADALDRARSLAQRAAAAGDRIGELCGRLRTLTYEGNIGTEGRTEELAALLDEAVPEFEAASHDLALYAAAQAATEIANMRVLMDQGLEAVERSQAYARRAGMLEVSRDWDTSFRFLGSIPLDRFVVWLDERNAISPKQLAYKARALAGLGRFDEARQLLAEATA